MKRALCVGVFHLTAGPCFAAVRVHGDGFDGVIFPKTKHAFRGDLNGQVDYWTPTRADIVKAEALAAKYIHDSKQIKENVAKYKRQYVGIVENGRKAVFIHFFCRVPDEWTREEIGVEDGGTCYF